MKKLVCLFCMLFMFSNADAAILWSMYKKFITMTVCLRNDSILNDPRLKNCPCDVFAFYTNEAYAESMDPDDDDDLIHPLKNDVPCNFYFTIYYVDGKNLIVVSRSKGNEYEIVVSPYDVVGDRCRYDENWFGQNKKAYTIAYQKDNNAGREVMNIFDDNSITYTIGSYLVTWKYNINKEESTSGHLFEFDEFIKRILHKRPFTEEENKKELEEKLKRLDEDSDEYEKLIKKEAENAAPKFGLG